MAQVVAMMGPIGAGKTSQNLRMAGRFNMATFSIGQLIRDDTHSEAHAAMKKGIAAPSDYVVELVLKRFSEIPPDQAIIFDGPELVNEAVIYQREIPKFGHKLAFVLHIHIDLAVAEERLAQRYYTAGRHDDHPETLRSRWQRYEEHTVPVIEFYRTDGVPVEEVDGHGNPDEVAGRIAEVFERYGIHER